MDFEHRRCELLSFFVTLLHKPQLAALFDLCNRRCELLSFFVTLLHKPQHDIYILQLFNVLQPMKQNKKINHVVDFFISYVLFPYLIQYKMPLKQLQLMISYGQCRFS